MKKHIHLAITLTLLLVIPGFLSAQRASPMKTAAGTIDNCNIVIEYSSPAVKGRTVWGGLVPYGKVWRTGANEATTFLTQMDILVEGKRLNDGKYGLFTEPGEKSWKVIFSETWDIWGTQYEESDSDVVVECDFVDSDEMYERLTFEVDDENNAIYLLWENKKVVINIEVAKEQED